MKMRWTTWLAVALWTASMTLAVGIVALEQIHGASFDQSIAVFVLALITSTATAGALLATHRSENPIGWIFLATALFNGVIVFAPEYGLHLNETPGTTPALVDLLFWLGAWTYIPVFMLPGTFVVLLFPTGKLPSRRWRSFAWLTAIWIGLWILAEMFSPGSLDPEPDGSFTQFTNPVGLSSMDGIFDAILSSGEIVPPVLVAIAVASIFARFRGATGIERQQLKWFTYAAMIPLLGGIIEAIPLVLGRTSNTYADTVGTYVWLIGIAILPVAIGIAILRHNLYDIDHLINHTLVYGSLTVFLGLGFAASVIALQLILSPLTGGNDLAVAASTLLTLAIFRPVRSRLQSFVDRRFYRRKYDSQQTLQSFGMTARDAVDLDQLTDEVTKVVGATMQPEHLSIWLRAKATQEHRR